MLTDKIRFLMREKSVSNNQMAEHLGISSQSLSNKFNRGSYSVEDLIKILDLLECQLVIRDMPKMSIELTKDDIRKKEQ